LLAAVGEDDGRAAARRLLERLREAGVPATAGFGDRPLKAQLKAADRSGAAYAAIVGERELTDGTVSLRRLADGSQESVGLDDVAARLAGEDP
jgi:histidyl-tRNA synthetase